MNTGKSHVLPILIAVLVTALVVGGGVFVWQKSENREGRENKENLKTSNEEVKEGKAVVTTKENVQDAVLVSQLPLSCPPSGEIVKGRFSDFTGYGKRPLIELYLDCNDIGISSVHLFFSESTDPLEKQEKWLYYSLNNGGLKWQFKDKEVQVLAAKSDVPWEKFTDFGGENPVKVLDLTLNGKELKVLDTPVVYKDGGLGGFQNVKFELTSVSEGILTFDGGKFSINLEKNTIKKI